MKRVTWQPGCGTYGQKAIPYISSGSRLVRPYERRGGLVARVEMSGSMPRRAISYSWHRSYSHSPRRTGFTTRQCHFKEGM